MISPPPAQCPPVVDVPLNGFRRQVGPCQALQKGPEAVHQTLAGRQIFVPAIHEHGQPSSPLL